MTMIGFIGLGRMGRPMASNLCRKGFRLIVMTSIRRRCAELELLQARAAGSVAEVAAASDIVVTMLPNSAAVRAGGWPAPTASSPTRSPAAWSWI